MNTFKLNRLILLSICLIAVLCLLGSCSHEDDLGQPLEGGTEMAMVSKLVNGDMNGALKRVQTVRYERQVGKSKWKRPNENNDGVVGYGSGERDYPNSIIFSDAKCLIEFLPHVHNYPPQFFLLNTYWELYCEQTRHQYRIFICVPYDYKTQENILKLGYPSYMLEFENSKGIQLACYSSDSYKEYKKTAIYTPDPSWSLDPDLMIVYDTPEQMSNDVIHRLKEAFGEDGKLSEEVLGSPKIRFEELEKEMAEMAYECPYWFAPKPAWR